MRFVPSMTLHQTIRQAQRHRWRIAETDEQIGSGVARAKPLGEIPADRRHFDRLVDMGVPNAQRRRLSTKRWKLRPTSIQPAISVRLPANTTLACIFIVLGIFGVKHAEQAPAEPAWHRRIAGTGGEETVACMQRLGCVETDRVPEFADKGGIVHLRDVSGNPVFENGLAILRARKHLYRNIIDPCGVYKLVDFVRLHLDRGPWIRYRSLRAAPTRLRQLGRSLIKASPDTDRSEFYRGEAG